MGIINVNDLTPNTLFIHEFYWLICPLWDILEN